MLVLEDCCLLATAEDWAIPCYQNLQSVLHDFVNNACHSKGIAAKGYAHAQAYSRKQLLVIVSWMLADFLPALGTKPTLEKCHLLDCLLTS